jgi:hypothetical protein
VVWLGHIEHQVTGKGDPVGRFAVGVVGHRSSHALESGESLAWQALFKLRSPLVTGLPFAQDR